MSAKKEYTEIEIVEGCVQNMRFFQELLYRRYFASMMQMCLRYTEDRDRAMDIVNNGFLRVFKKIATFSFNGSLEGWIRRIVYHSLSDYFKNENKYLHFMVFEERDANFQDRTLDKMYYEDILKMVQLLPPATREVFRLYAIEGFSHAEIAETLNISTGTSKWHLSDAREKLKALIFKSMKIV